MNYQEKKKNQKKTENKPNINHFFVFNKQNYKLLILGLIFIITGYFMMIGGGSHDPNVFSTKIFSTPRWTIAPILILIGLTIEVFAIIKKS